MSDITSWVGRSVRITGGLGEGIVGIVLAVDDTPWRPSAWVKGHLDRDYPVYRSVDLCDVEDETTGECGPAWGTGGPAADAERFKLKEHQP